MEVCIREGPLFFFLFFPIPPALFLKFPNVNTCKWIHTIWDGVEKSLGYLRRLCDHRGGHARVKKVITLTLIGVAVLSHLLVFAVRASLLPLLAVIAD